jgi:hypothetical protein
VQVAPVPAATAPTQAPIAQTPPIASTPMLRGSVAAPPAKSARPRPARPAPTSSAAPAEDDLELNRRQ